MSDEQDRAEAVDWDEIGTGDRYDGEPPEFPPDRPLGVEDDGVIQSVEQMEEPLAERVAREEPDPLAQELDRSEGGPG